MEAAEQAIIFEHFRSRNTYVFIRADIFMALGNVLARGS